MQTRLRDCVKKGFAGPIQLYFLRHLDWIPELPQLRDVMKSLEDAKLYHDNDSVIMVIKKRLADRGVEPKPGENPGYDVEALSMLDTATLHVFLWAIPETAEQLLRLTNEIIDKEKREVARSKIFNTQQKPRPIDSVAVRVMGKRE